MCALGVYLAFLLLEDMFVGNFSTNTTQNQNLTYQHADHPLRKDTVQYKHINKRSIKAQNIYISNISTTSWRPGRKFYVGNVTQTQYEIINMLWRKTKMFGDVDNTVYRTTNKRTNVTKMLRNKGLYRPLITTSSIPAPPLQSTTTSKIEFYYMDDKQYLASEKNCTHRYCKSNEIKKKTSNSPFLIFHLKGPYVNAIPLPIAKRFNYSRLRNDRVKISAIRLKEVQELSQMSTFASILWKNGVKTTTHNRTFYSLPPKTHNRHVFDSNSLIKRAISSPSDSNNHIIKSCNNRYTYVTESDKTTVYDKIKFFEIYDKFTRAPSTRKSNFIIGASYTKADIVDNYEKILLEHIGDGSHDHVQAKHKKKHITESSSRVHFVSKAVTKSTRVVPNNTHNKQPNATTYFINENTTLKQNISNTDFSYVNETALWSDYPFAAVYIYEPSQVHCDAAAISNHWLIASGSCLSRVSSIMSSLFEPDDEGQSAFVAYCGARWWEPERVAHVKYTIVHPQYHPRDKTRQHLYNIGAIQVVNSMTSACTGWSPVTLMSYQFAAAAETTLATAIGWGLDRFDTRYGATDLPRTPLMVYKSVVYFDSCPGNVGYSKAKRLYEGGGVGNVHCLALPPYYGEDTDPVHGGLLLADGKLIALYLQEERRPWGYQSAQYTGLWRIIPWLMDVAREPEEMDTVIFDL